ncbi:MAG TPA: AbrB/MazE/SpoVT family DNA-binding domain-containing protein [Thermoanaerobaculia bacterium]
MSKVTSKLQVTIPKAIAERCGIEPGDEIEWNPSGDAIRVTRSSSSPAISREERLAMFDRATARQRRRQKRARFTTSTPRGWTREDLYRRGSSR